MKKLISIQETCEALGVGRTMVYLLIREEKLDTCRIGRRRLVRVESIDRFLGESD